MKKNLLLTLCIGLIVAAVVMIVYLKNIDVEKFEEVKEAIEKKIQTLSGYLCSSMPFLNDGPNQILEEEKDFYEDDIDYLQRAPEDV